LNKKTAIVKDIVKNIPEKEISVIGKDSGKDIRKKSGKKSIEILDDNNNNNI